MTKRTILEVYALAVCFITVACFAIALGILVYDVIEIAAPSFTLGQVAYERHASNDRYWEEQTRWGNPENKPSRPTEEELTKRREASLKIALASERRDGLQGFVRSLIVVAIDIIVFLPHWWLARRARIPA